MNSLINSFINKYLKCYLKNIEKLNFSIINSCLQISSVVPDIEYINTLLALNNIGIKISSGIISNLKIEFPYNIKNSSVKIYIKNIQLFTTKSDIDQYQKPSHSHILDKRTKSNENNQLKKNSTKSCDSSINKTSSLKSYKENSSYLKNNFINFTLNNQINKNESNNKKSSSFWETIQDDLLYNLEVYIDNIELYSFFDKKIIYFCFSNITYVPSEILDNECFITLKEEIKHFNYYFQYDKKYNNDEVKLNFNKHFFKSTTNYLINNANSTLRKYLEVKYISVGILKKIGDKNNLKIIDKLNFYAYFDYTTDVYMFSKLTMVFNNLNIYFNYNIIDTFFAIYFELFKHIESIKSYIIKKSKIKQYTNNDENNSMDSSNSKLFNSSCEKLNNNSTKKYGILFDVDLIFSNFVFMLYIDYNYNISLLDIYAKYLNIQLIKDVKDFMSLDLLELNIYFYDNKNLDNFYNNTCKEISFNIIDFENLNILKNIYSNNSNYYLLTINIIDNNICENENFLHLNSKVSNKQILNKEIKFIVNLSYILNTRTSSVILSSTYNDIEESINILNNLSISLNLMIYQNCLNIISYDIEINFTSFELHLGIQEIFVLLKSINNIILYVKKIFKEYNIYNNLTEANKANNIYKLSQNNISTVDYSILLLVKFVYSTNINIEMDKLCCKEIIINLPRIIIKIGNYNISNNLNFVLNQISNKSIVKPNLYTKFNIEFSEGNIKYNRVKEYSVKNTLISENNKCYLYQVNIKENTFLDIKLKYNIICIDDRNNLIINILDNNILNFNSYSVKNKQYHINDYDLNDIINSYSHENNKNLIKKLYFTINNLENFINSNSKPIFENKLELNNVSINLNFYAINSIITFVDDFLNVFKCKQISKTKEKDYNYEENETNINYFSINNYNDKNFRYYSVLSNVTSLNFELTIISNEKADLVNYKLLSNNYVLLNNINSNIRISTNINNKIYFFEYSIKDIFILIDANLKLNNNVKSNNFNIIDYIHLQLIDENCIKNINSNNNSLNNETKGCIDIFMFFEYEFMNTNKLNLYLFEKYIHFSPFPSLSVNFNKNSLRYFTNFKHQFLSYFFIKNVEYNNIPSKTVTYISSFSNLGDSNLCKTNLASIKLRNLFEYKNKLKNYPVVCLTNNYLKIRNFFNFDIKIINDNKDEILTVISNNENLLDCSLLKNLNSNKYYIMFCNNYDNNNNYSKYCFDNYNNKNLISNCVNNMFLELNNTNKILREYDIKFDINKEDVIIIKAVLQNIFQSSVFKENNFNIYEEFNENDNNNCNYNKMGKLNNIKVINLVPTLCVKNNTENNLYIVINEDSSLEHNIYNLNSYLNNLSNNAITTDFLNDLFIFESNLYKLNRNNDKTIVLSKTKDEINLSKTISSKITTIRLAMSYYNVTKEELIKTTSIITDNKYNNNSIEFNNDNLKKKRSYFIGDKITISNDNDILIFVPFRSCEDTTNKFYIFRINYIYLGEHIFKINILSFININLNNFCSLTNFKTFFIDDIKNKIKNKNLNNTYSKNLESDKNYIIIDENIIHIKHLNYSSNNKFTIDDLDLKNKKLIKLPYNIQLNFNNEYIDNNYFEFNLDSNIFNNVNISIDVPFTLESDVSSNLSNKNGLHNLYNNLKLFKEKFYIPINKNPEDSLNLLKLIEYINKDKLIICLNSNILFNFDLKKLLFKSSMSSNYSVQQLNSYDKYLNTNCIIEVKIHNNKTFKYEIDCNLDYIKYESSDYLDVFNYTNYKYNLEYVECNNKLYTSIEKNNRKDYIVEGLSNSSIKIDNELNLNTISIEGIDCKLINSNIDNYSNLSKTYKYIIIIYKYSIDDKNNFYFKYILSVLDTNVQILIEVYNLFNNITIVLKQFNSIANSNLNKNTFNSHLNKFFDVSKFDIKISNININLDLNPFYLKNKENVLNVFINKILSSIDLKYLCYNTFNDNIDLNYKTVKLYSISIFDYSIVIGNYLKLQSAYITNIIIEYENYYLLNLNTFKNIKKHVIQKLESLNGNMYEFKINKDALLYIIIKYCSISNICNKFSYYSNIIDNFLNFDINNDEIFIKYCSNVSFVISPSSKLDLSYNQSMLNFLMLSIKNVNHLNNLIKNLELYKMNLKKINKCYNYPVFNSYNYIKTFKINPFEIKLSLNINKGLNINIENSLITFSKITICDKSYTYKSNLYDLINLIKNSYLKQSKLSNIFSIISSTKILGNFKNNIYNAFIDKFKYALKHKSLLSVIEVMYKPITSSISSIYGIGSEITTSIKDNYWIFTDCGFNKEKEELCCFILLIYIRSIYDKSIIFQNNKLFDNNKTKLIYDKIYRGWNNLNNILKLKLFYSNIICLVSKYVNNKISSNLNLINCFYNSNSFLSINNNLNIKNNIEDLNIELMNTVSIKSATLEKNKNINCLQRDFYLESNFVFNTLFTLHKNCIITDSNLLLINKYLNYSKSKHFMVKLIDKDFTYNIFDNKEAVAIFSRLFLLLFKQTNINSNQYYIYYTIPLNKLLSININTKELLINMCYEKNNTNINRFDDVNLVDIQNTNTISIIFTNIEDINSFSNYIKSNIFN